MQPADLNLTTDVVGHQRMLFVRLPPGASDTGLAQSIDSLGEGMENMHEGDGSPSDAAFGRGRFQSPWSLFPQSTGLRPVLSRCEDTLW